MLKALLEIYLREVVKIMELSEKEIKERLPCFAIGISNRVDLGDKHFALQFYDLDKKQSVSKLELIKTLFKGRDCIVFKTKHGKHFVSLMLDFKHKPKYYVKRARKVSKKIRENYIFKDVNYLVLRISPKKKESNKKIVSGRPVFYKLLQEPSKEMSISAGHLKIYAHYLRFPRKVLDKYLECNLIKTKVKLHTYRTRD